MKTRRRSSRISGNAAVESPESSTLDYFGYSHCIKLENDSTRVVLCPQAGGRMLEYAWKGNNVLFLDPQQKGWTDGPGQPYVDPCGGRFDIGPEQTIARHPALWRGNWTGQSLGPRAARLTSVKDEATGVQLLREFWLDASSSHLTCRQIVTNISDRPVSCCHWSRTLAQGGGICIVPLTPESRFPKSYILYGPGPVMNYEPDDPNIRVRSGFLEILGTPKQPKLGLDSCAGWLAYLSTNDLMFVKRFPVYPNRVYSEMAGLTVSIYYFENKMCELEPIGPRERLCPGQSASFTEDWWLVRYTFPRPGSQVDLDQISQIVERAAR